MAPLKILGVLLIVAGVAGLVYGGFSYTKEEHKAKLKVDATKTPHTIDILPTEGDSKGKTFPGIYKLEKGEVTLVFTEKGDRPKDFKAEGEAMMIRMKKADK